MKRSFKITIIAIVYLIFLYTLCFAGNAIMYGYTWLNAWEPDWEENSEKSIITKFRNAVVKFNTKEQYTFAFPTEEMRDAFYENFKELIEQCKELL